MTIKVTRSDESTCLDGATISRIATLWKEHIPAYHRDIHGRVTVRDMWPVVMRGVALLADVKTGTLYNKETGECLSSSQMRLVLDKVPTTKRRKDLSARSYDGWLNDKRRAA